MSEPPESPDLEEGESQRTRQRPTILRQLGRGVLLALLIYVLSLLVTIFL